MVNQLRLVNQMKQVSQVNQANEIIFSLARATSVIDSVTSATSRAKYCQNVLTFASEQISDRNSQTHTMVFCRCSEVLLLSSISIIICIPKYYCYKSSQFK